ncbi:Regucalcin [Vanrija pseudolonga]|uniref:Regucalcin n=1 Tax=Vanrija pseudolonga TaxID=143232 RepID=A0AAF0Y5N9_9TREE|nr:Regucalcin [Vanrija pseudolonga]
MGQDSRTKRLYFVDIDLNAVYVYHPGLDKYGYSHFDKNVTAIALLASQDGLIAAIEDGFAFIPPSSLPSPILNRTDSPAAQFKLGSPERSYQPLSTATTIGNGEARFNEGACDPVGRFLAGTMGKEFGTSNARMYSLRPAAGGTWQAPLVLDGITCTNGMAWVNGGKKLVFTDSWVKEIVTFDYNVGKGTIANRGVFSNITDPKYGYPDGLCVDDQGGVWTARWAAGKVLRLNPDTAEIDVEIDLPNAWNATCCIFGGDDLEDLYITTARGTQDAGNLAPADRNEEGKLYVVKGTGYRGVDRNRFNGRFDIDV